MSFAYGLGGEKEGTTFDTIGAIDLADHLEEFVLQESS